MLGKIKNFFPEFFFKTPHEEKIRGHPLETMKFFPGIQGAICCPFILLKNPPQGVG
jgi:hypothetical protein